MTVGDLFESLDRDTVIRELEQQGAQRCQALRTYGHVPYLFTMS
ncbi:hypothetical protein [Bradyrhizobium sp. BR 1432]